MNVSGPIVSSAPTTSHAQIATVGQHLADALLCGSRVCGLSEKQGSPGAGKSVGRVTEVRLGVGMNGSIGASGLERSGRTALPLIWLRLKFSSFSAL